MLMFVISLLTAGPCRIELYLSIDGIKRTKTRQVPLSAAKLQKSHNFHQDDSVNATFVDVGAGQFFIDVLTSKEQDEPDQQDRPVKRQKYATTHLKESAEISSGQALGGALGPDWHEGLAIKGAMKYFSSSNESIV